jgi:hypothetical protein
VGLHDQSIEVTKRASARTARIAAGSAGASRSGAARRALRRYGKHGGLRIKLGGMALRALRLLFAVHESFELMMAFLANVFEDGHGQLQRYRSASIRINPWELRKLRRPPGATFSRRRV